MKISRHLRAAALGLPLLASTPAHGTIPVPPLVTPEASPFAPPPPQDGQCAGPRPSYSDQDLQSINAKLGDLHQWMASHGALGAGSRVAGFDGVYAAGTENGKDYLSKDPGNIIAVIDAYKEQVANFTPGQSAGFGEGEAAKIRWLEKVMQETLVAIVVYAQSECRTAPALHAPSV